ncbi:hypothetical protein ACFFH4_27035 [Halalkalibacter alkalisediminis]|uniref:Uncharacterized protein n=1 Tax=Halalkalibacter alkalisediminis TaxID=935616 RepID=A0ABV6NP00_9BACI
MRRIKKLSSVLGVIAGLASIILWLVFIFFNPYSSAGIGTILISFFMLLLPALLAVKASIQYKDFELLIAFIWSLPYSVYFAFTPGIFALFGISCLLYLVSFILIKIQIS